MFLYHRFSTTVSCFKAGLYIRSLYSNQNLPYRTKQSSFLKSVQYMRWKESHFHPPANTYGKASQIPFGFESMKNFSAEISICTKKEVLKWAITSN